MQIALYENPTVFSSQKGEADAYSHRLLVDTTSSLALEYPPGGYSDCIWSVIPDSYSLVAVVASRLTAGKMGGGLILFGRFHMSPRAAGILGLISLLAGLAALLLLA